VEGIARWGGRGFFDVTENGLLIYQVGGSPSERLTWFDRAGKELGVIGEAGVYYQLRLSPDGAKLAFDAGDPSDLWVNELLRSVRMRLTNDPETDKGMPVWSPNGSRILYGAGWAFTRCLPTGQAERNCCCRRRSPTRKYSPQAGLATAISSSIRADMHTACFARRPGSCL
jgi:Tol biopolymer transport system component